jgi:hypothetical protein
MISDPTLLALAQRNRRRRERKQAATPGPWTWEDVDEKWLSGPFRSDEMPAVIGAIGDDGLTARVCVEPENATFIAEARNDPVEDDVDLLLAEVRRLRGEANP